MSIKLQSLLAAAFTDVEIAVLICGLVLSVVLIAVSIVLLIVLKKKSAAAEKQPREKQTPIVIYETEKVKAAQEEPAPAEEPATAEEVAVSEAVAPAESLKSAVVEDETEYAMRYNRSFRARLIQSDDQIKEWYGLIKNAILTYKHVSSRISWKYESFSYKRNAVAKLFIKGKTLYLYLPLNAADYADSKYKLEDVSKVAQFAETPALYKLKSERRIKYANELLEQICQKLGCVKTEREPVDYYEPYNSDVALIKKGLVKRIVEDAKTSFIGASGYSKAQDEDTEFDDKK